MEENHNKNNLRNSPIVIMFIVFCCVLVNFVGKHSAVTHELPLWLDSLGTIFAAYVLGPASGAIVGCSTNIIYFFWDPKSLAYALTSIFIGISFGLAARKRYFDSFFGATTVAGGVTFGSVIISTILNLFFYDGFTGNVWGDGVVSYFMEKGIPKIIASTIGEMYLDFLDKVCTVLFMYFIVRMVRSAKRERRLHHHLPSLILLILSLGVSSLAPSFKASAAVYDNTYIQRFYNADNGLPCGHANDIAQTFDGMLWVGSYSGLYRYNGTNFTFMDEFDSVKNVNCLYVDEEGRLWIGTNDSGVVVAIDGRQVSVFDTNKGLPSDSVRSIVQCSNGDYYIGTSDQMVVVCLKDGIRVKTEISKIRYAQSVTADRSGNVATVTAEGKLYVLKDGKIDFEIKASASDIRFSSCRFSPEGLLYASTSDGRILVYRINNGAAMLQHTIKCVGVTEINRIYFDNSRVWVLADNGIGVIEGYTYSHVSTEDFNSSIVNMTVDYQGNFWFASTRHGLLQLSESCFSNLYVTYGIDPAVVNSTALMDGILYIGADNGLSAVDLYPGLVLNNDLTRMYEGVRIRCLTKDSLGNLWICSYGKGLACMLPSGRIVEFDTETMGIGKRVRGCIELSDATIAVSADSGLSLIRGYRVVKTIPYGNELGSSQILSMCQTPDGKLYLGTDGNGIVIYDNSMISGHLTKEDGLGSEVILKMVYDEESDAMFIVTSNSICVMKNGVIKAVTNFPYSNNYDIVLDKDGEAFVLGSAGIYVVNKDDLLNNSVPDCQLLNSRLGLQCSLTANSWNTISRYGDLYLSTDRGVYKFNLDDYRNERQAYRIMVSKIIIDGIPIIIERGNSLSISRDVNTIEFIPEIINFSLEDPKISYYLEGIDSGYKTVSQSEITSAVYTNLPAGEYIFHIAIIDEETGRIIEESTYGFVKENSIYDNNWFMLYMLLVGGLFVGWATWFGTRYRAQKAMKLQQEKLALALKQVSMGNETIMAIARTVDAKDALTSRHSQRVSEYSVMIARKYGFSGDEIDNLRKAALLHDIGKIGIPDAILNKPSALTEKEYECMKSHVTLGAEILKDFTLVENAAQGAKYHHERYDGTGYPEGLKGSEIPLYGRIIAIADAFDAMTANRVYRKRMPFEKVMDELHKGRGTQFDPELLDMFLELIENGDIDTASLYSDILEDESSAD